VYCSGAWWDDGCVCHLSVAGFSSILYQEKRPPSFFFLFFSFSLYSKTNSADEMAEKTAIYLASGAQEVWILAETGAMSFHDVSGEQPRSRIVREFPAVIAKP
jgi:hypothetical protein